MERTRAGAVTVREGWAIDAGWAPGIEELMVGLAAGGMVIHDRSSRTESGEFCGWKIVGRSGFSFAPPAKG